MKRIKIAPRDNWQKRLEDAGCFYHTLNDETYWVEDAAYVFTSAEIDAIDDATAELNAMAISHVVDTITKGDYQGYDFKPEVIETIERSWKSGHLSVYQRYDLGYDGTHIKMFECNADTPTMLVEPSIWQWHALEDRGWPDQFNSIHEKLIEWWRTIRSTSDDAAHVHFTAMKDAGPEDWATSNYLLETASEAGISCSSLAIEDIGWHDYQRGDGVGIFVDARDKPIKTVSKLYPWEWLLQDQYGWQAMKAETVFIEPAWKLLLSSKACLPLLWDKHKWHPNLLPAYFTESATPNHEGEWAVKPRLGREGSNTRKVRQGVVLETGEHNPHYDKYGYIRQRWMPVPTFDGYTPIIGSWVIGDQTAGIGIREDKAKITSNKSRFVPHYFEG